MSLKDWADNRWLRSHRSDPEEIEGLFSIVDRDLRDAAKRDISADWRFGIAYNAALKLCTILIHASGYRPERTLQHYRTIAALPLVLGKQRAVDAAYLEACRTKRNTAEYDTAGVATDAEADELLQFAGKFRQEVMDWLREHHPRLVPGGEA